jgi:hypothetical protein
MANTIQLKYSDTTGTVPTLAAGELAINRADGVLFYTNASNTVTKATLVNAVLKSLLASATSTIATNTNTNLSFSIGVNEVWIAEFLVTAQCSGTGGSKFQISAPTGATIEGWLESTTTTANTVLNQRITAINTLTGTATHTVATTPAPDTILVRIKNSTTAGTVALGFASVTAGQTTTIFAGSFLRAYKATEV